MSIRTKSPISSGGDSQFSPRAPPFSRFTSGLNHDEGEDDSIKPIFVSLFSEGGRLQKEIKYVESNLGLGAGSTSEMIIQTPSDDGGTSSILTAEALLSHLEILQKASKVVVEQDDVYVFPVYQADFSRVKLEYLFCFLFFTGLGR